MTIFIFWLILFSVMPTSCGHSSYRDLASWPAYGPCLHGKLIYLREAAIAPSYTREACDRVFIGLRWEMAARVLSQALWPRHPFRLEYRNVFCDPKITCVFHTQSFVIVRSVVLR